MPTTDERAILSHAVCNVCTCSANRHTFDEKCNAERHTWEPPEGSFGRLPYSVLSDPRLRASDVKAYAAMALYERGGKVETGMRRLAGTCKMRLGTFSQATRRLIETGHVSMYPRKQGGRALYRLESSVFGGTESAKPMTGLTCARCGAACRRLGPQAWCRSCARHAKQLADVLAIVRALGPGATDAQIADEMHTRKITARLRAVILEARGAA